MVVVEELWCDQYLSSSSAPSKKEAFATAFKNSVHGGLDMVLGQSSTDAILHFTNITENVPDPGEFHNSLLGLFGQEGAVSLERTIVKDLLTRLKGPLDFLDTEDPFDFDAAINAAEKEMRTLPLEGLRAKPPVDVDSQAEFTGSGSSEQANN